MPSGRVVGGPHLRAPSVAAEGTVLTVAADSIPGQGGKFATDVTQVARIPSTPSNVAGLTESSRGHDPAGPEAGIDLHCVVKTSQQETGPDQQHHGHPDLADDQERLGAGAAARKSSRGRPPSGPC